MPKLYEKIEIPYPIEVSNADDEQFNNLYGHGYAWPNREKINHNLMCYCPTQALRLQYEANCPEIMGFFEQSWSYLHTYLLPAIKENYQSLIEIRFSKANELPTHITMMRIVNTMRSILTLLDAWLDSNGCDRFQFSNLASNLLKNVLDKFKPFAIVAEKDLTKRIKHLYIKIHWDAFTKAYDELCYYMQTDLEKWWEYGMQRYLNYRDFPLEDGPELPNLGRPDE
jgi:hypothetical protein